MSDCQPLACSLTSMVTATHGPALYHSEFGLICADCLAGRKARIDGEGAPTYEHPAATVARKGKVCDWHHRQPRYERGEVNLVMETQQDTPIHCAGATFGTETARNLVRGIAEGAAERAAEANEQARAIERLEHAPREAVEVSLAVSPRQLKRMMAHAHRRNRRKDLTP